MKYFVATALLIGCTLPAVGQPHAPDRAFTPPQTDAPPLSVVLRDAAQPPAASSAEAPLALGVDAHLDGWDAPAAWEEFPAAVATSKGPRYLDTYRVYPSSLGGWITQIMAGIVCSGAADGGVAEQQCDAIGKRAYRYPRF